METISIVSDKVTPLPKMSEELDSLYNKFPDLQDSIRHLEVSRPLTGIRWLKELTPIPGALARRHLVTTVEHKING